MVVHREEHMIWRIVDAHEMLVKYQMQRAKGIIDEYDFVEIMQPILMEIMNKFLKCMNTGNFIPLMKKYTSGYNGHFVKEDKYNTYSDIKLMKNKENDFRKYRADTANDYIAENNFEKYELYDGMIPGDVTVSYEIDQPSKIIFESGRTIDEYNKISELYSSALSIRDPVERIHALVICMDSYVAWAHESVSDVKTSFQLMGHVADMCPIADRDKTVDICSDVLDMLLGQHTRSSFGESYWKTDIAKIRTYMRNNMPLTCRKPNISYSYNLSNQPVRITPTTYYDYWDDYVFYAEQRQEYGYDLERMTVDLIGYSKCGDWVVSENCDGKRYLKAKAMWVSGKFGYAYHHMYEPGINPRNITPDDVYKHMRDKLNNYGLLAIPPYSSGELGY